MSIYYIRAELDEGVVQVALDATTNNTERLGGRLTKFILEDGLEGSDHYIVTTDRVSFTGVISDLKSSSSGMRGPASSSQQNDGSIRYHDSVTNKKRMELIRETKVPFTVYTGDKVISNCRFTSLEFRQTGSAGVVGDLYSYAVSFTAEKIRTGSRAEAVSVRDEELLKAYEAKAVIPGNKQNPKAEEKRRKLLDAIKNRRFGSPLTP